MFGAERSRGQGEVLERHHRHRRRSRVRFDWWSTGPEASVGAVRGVPIVIEQSSQRSLPLALRLMLQHEFRGIRLQQMVKSEASRLLLVQLTAIGKNLK